MAKNFVYHYCYWHQLQCTVRSLARHVLVTVHLLLTTPRLWRHCAHLPWQSHCVLLLWRSFELHSCFSLSLVLQKWGFCGQGVSNHSWLLSASHFLTRPFFSSFRSSSRLRTFPPPPPSSSLILRGISEWISNIWCNMKNSIDSSPFIKAYNYLFKLSRLWSIWANFSTESSLGTMILALKVHGGLCQSFTCWSHGICTP